MQRRFVVLFHEMPCDDDRASHFDWMFEMDGALRTWAVESIMGIKTFDSETSSSEQFRWPAVKLANHRIDYLEYEGPISKNRGKVSRRLIGEFDLLHDTEGSFQASLRILQPSYVFPITIRFVKEENNWCLISEKRWGSELSN